MLTRDRPIVTSVPSDDPVVHDLYGIRVRTPWPVTGVPAVRRAWDVEFLPGNPRTLDDAAAHVEPAQRTATVQHAVLPDGSRYRRWIGLFDFLVTPDARRIHARMLDRANDEALLAYLLVDGLSYSMVRLGREPLHATAVLTDRGAAAFVGESGDGKSTLGALLVRAGSRLITDDMLVLTQEREQWLAQPGPPRIKLYRPIAERIFGSPCAGVPMNPVTDKLILALAARHTVRTPVPLDAVYLLERHDQGLGDGAAPAISRLPPARAFSRVLAATTGHYPSDRERLTRQLEFVSRLVSRIPVKILRYRRDFDDAGILRDAVLADLDRVVN